jgi:hypothetical protein
MNINPPCPDYTSEDCRSVLNMVTGSGKETKLAGTEDDWVTVESKKTKRARRVVSHMKNNDSRRMHENNNRKHESVRFGKA